MPPALTLVLTMDHEYPISSSGDGVTASDRPELSWRIPVNEGALEFRARSLRILIASGIFLALVMIFGGEEIRRVALIALAPLALLLMWWVKLFASLASWGEKLC